MTIVGLTDNIVPRYPRLGKLRKGGEKTANGYGPDLDHFRFVSPYPEVAKAFNELYPGKPDAIKIFIPHDTVEDAFSTTCEVWNKTGMVHRCNGQVMSIWREGAKYVKGTKPCMGGHRDGDPLRDALGRLEFIIPGLVAKGFVGYVTLETHSIHDILNLSSVIAAVYKSQGTVAGVEFTLRRVKENISTPGWGDRANDRSRVDKWLVRLEPSSKWVKAQLDHDTDLALRAPAVVQPQLAGHAAAPLPALTAPAAYEDLPEVSESVSAPTQPAASTPSQEVIKNEPPASGNGKTKLGAKAKTAAIKASMKSWNDFCARFAARFPHYRNEEQTPDKFHIGAAVVACGFAEVTNENFEEVSAALIKRAVGKAEPEPA